MVPERLMQLLKMTDLLPEACPRRTGFSKTDMGHCSGEPVRGEQHKVRETDTWTLLVMAPLGSESRGCFIS